MDEYGTPITLSKLPNISEDQPYDQNTLFFNGGGSLAWPYPHHIPPPYSSTGHHDHNLDLVPAHKKPRGRPHGSKNKPKPTTVSTKESDDFMKLVSIEVSIGCDVVEAIVKFAHLHNVGISVLSGSGSISNVTLHNPFPHSPYFTLNGSFTLVSLSGTYISNLSNPYTLMATPSSASIPNHPFSDAASSFGISVLGSQGEILGGVVAGKVVAESTVTVIATVFKKPEFHRVGFNVNGEVNASGNDSMMMMSNFLNPQAPYAPHVPYANVNMFQ
ncbi:hypothetical protein TanjilG_28971 [Lupinus angustifolius]|uniref:PPC domain-containing protein n=1 Tax=Lupinus angustifolius TaxID=3871 RepID=A0A4P1RSK8_LUPAN|nr:PREDICTED: AT-hook motif nuclear-localized protein 28-like [Lupinus angustifolius]OIW17621.1 hypothetical protein TanjilG_28971 [Lupinus angustifolius]